MKDFNNKDKSILTCILSFIAGGFIISILGNIKISHMKKKLKKAEEKNLQFQEIIRKHEAMIKEMEHEKDRIIYMYELFNDFMNSQEKK